MKISLSWIADHIKVNKTELNPAHIAEQLGAITAEIDAVERVRTDLASLYAATLVELQEQEVVLECPELRKSVTLPKRKDSYAKHIYLIKKDGNELRWAMLTDVGSGKDGLLPSVSVREKDLKGAWKNSIDAEDTIITIENKAITNRPDLWGHRGIAREVAAILHKQLTLEDSLYASVPIKHYERKAQPNGSTPFEIEIADALHHAASLVIDWQCFICQQLPTSHQFPGWQFVWRE